MPQMLLRRFWVVPLFEILISQLHVCSLSIPSISLSFSKSSGLSKHSYLATCRPTYEQLTRWVIPPNGSVQLLVQFQSDTVGKFTEVLNFNVLCGERENSVVLSGVSDYPRISTEHR